MTIFYLISVLVQKLAVFWQVHMPCRKLSYAKLARVDDLTNKLGKFDSIPDPSFRASNYLFLAVMVVTRLI